MTRDERQALGEKKVLKALSKYRVGLVSWATGVGKTRLITHRILPRIRKAKASSVSRYKYPFTVLVGTSWLKNQWLEKVEKDTNVLTWQSIYKQSVGSIKTKLLVIDEAQEIMLTKKYSRALKVVQAERVILLSATPQEELLDLLKAVGGTVMDHIPRDEARKHGWVSNWVEFNIPVPLTKEENEELFQMEHEYLKNTLFLDINVSEIEEELEKEYVFPRYENLEKCRKYVPKAIFYRHSGGQIETIPIEKDFYVKNVRAFYNHIDQVAKKYGGKQNFVLYKAGPNKGKIKMEKSFPYAERIAKLRDVPVETVLRTVKETAKLLNRRNALLYNNSNKLKVCEHLIDYFKDRKGFVFAMQAEFCDRLYEIMPEKSRPYHNKIPSEKESYLVEKVYKTKPNKWIQKTRRVSSKKIMERYMEEFNDESSPINWIISIRKIQSGADSKGVSVAINASSTSKKEANKQKTGRVIRVDTMDPDKLAVVINLYSTYTGKFSYKDSLEKIWLRKSQEGDERPVWVNSVRQFKEIYENLI